MFDFLRYKNNQAVITDRGEALSYGELEQFSVLFSSKIVSGAFLLCLCDNTLASFLGYVSCIYRGIPLALVDCHKDNETIVGLFEAYKPEYIWLPKERISEVGGVTVFEYGGYNLQRVKEKPFGGDDVYRDLALCLTTSGSTGSPKFVRLSKMNLSSNAESISSYLEVTEQDRPVMSLPMFYSYGISIINSYLYKGATILLTDKSIMQREFWNFIRDYEATAFSGVPFTYEMLLKLRFFQMRLPKLKVLTQAGGKLSPDIVAKYAEFANENGKLFFVMYGQTEASPRISFLPPSVAMIKPSSIGIPIPGGSLSLIDEGGREIAEPFKNGELIYRGDNVCLGYAESRKDLSLGNTNNGVLFTGDIAYFDEDGYYYISGRKKRFVKIFGNRVNLDAIEQLVKKNEVECACIGNDNKIMLFITDARIKDSVLQYLINKTGFNSKVFEVIVLSDIPKNARGKCDYQELMTIVNNTNN